MTPDLHPISERLTDVAAIASVASPWWLPWLSTTSEIAGLLLPVLGVIWLIVQIWVRVKHNR